MDTKVKFSSKIERKTLDDLKTYAEQSKKNISTVLNEAVEQYLDRISVRAAFISTASDIIEENKELLEELAK